MRNSFPYVPCVVLLEASFAVMPRWIIQALCEVDSDTPGFASVKSPITC